VLCVGDSLFHRVILHSGSALNPWAVVSKPETQFSQLAAEVAARFNCTEPIASSSHHHHQQQEQEQDQNQEQEQEQRQEQEQQEKKKQEQLQEQEHQQQEHLVECLRQLSVDQLITIELPTLRYRSTVGPTVNERGGLLTADVRQLMMSHDSRAPWSRLNVMLGFVSNEGILK